MSGQKPPPINDKTSLHPFAHFECTKVQKLLSGWVETFLPPYGYCVYNGNHLYNEDFSLELLLGDHRLPGHYYIHTPNAWNHTNYSVVGCCKGDHATSQKDHINGPIPNF